MNNKRILWISCLAWKNIEYDYPVNGPGAVSGSIFQQSIIQGLIEKGYKVDVISDYPYKEPKNRQHRIIKSDNLEIYYLPTFKNNYFNLLYKYKRIHNAVKYFLKQYSYDFSIGYLIHSPYLYGLKLLKKVGCQTTLICPDLPDMMDMSLREKKLKRLLKKIDAQILTRLYHYVDGYVLFTSLMKEKLPVGEKPSVVIEGVATLGDLVLSSEIKSKAIMHAGTLHKNIGIENIIESFHYIKDPDIELWIFGDGELRPNIEEAAKHDSRIKYKGFVTREKLFKYEQQAMLLINARNPEDEFTKYSFPSKTFEYLYSGTPLLTTFLSGMPIEYAKYQLNLENNQPKTIARNISNYISQPLYLAKFGEKARSFVVEYKNYLIQTEKLISYLKNLS